MIGILGFITIIIATIYAYRTAKDYHRNAISWALIVFGVGFGIQFVIPLLFGIALAIYLIAGGSSEVDFQESYFGLAVVIDIVCIALSVIAMVMLLKRIPQFSDETPVEAPPPPPTDFNL